MRERPILMSGPMALAAHNGTKTQTRRVVKVPWRGSTKTTPYEPYYVDDGGVLMVGIDGPYRPFVDVVASPYGVPGDRLWVRETHSFVGCSDDHPAAMPWGTHNIRGGDFEGEMGCEKFRVAYRASRDDAGCNEDGNEVWRPSIHMPRWASRTILEVTDARIERLQDITEEDAKAEGIREVTKDGVVKKFCFDHSSTPWAEMPRRAVSAFAALWNSIYGPGAWLANPWVWVGNFKRVDLKGGAR